LPQWIGGRISEPGDTDVFEFFGSANEEVVVEVQARSLGSPLDSLVRLSNAAGDVLAWNDDYSDKSGHLHRDMGLLTHHADSYLQATLPGDGTYFVSIGDAQRHGSDAHTYRLRVSERQPDFALRIVPSSIALRPGISAPLDVHVLRRDGFDGEIELRLAKAPVGLLLSGGRIPAGLDRTRVTLTAPRQPLPQAVEVRLEGRAVIDGQVAVRPGVPAEDVMQAFLYRHLVPTQELLLSVTAGWPRLPPIDRAGGTPVLIPSGGQAVVRFRIPGRRATEGIQLELVDAPPGLSLADVTLTPQGLAVVIRVTEDGPQIGYEDNLIVAAAVERPVRQQQAAQGHEPQKTRMVPLGVLPAIPFRIVQ
jgi:hypothetical protein